jgi:Tol biopolymer transport system component
MKNYLIVLLMLIGSKSYSQDENLKLVSPAGEDAVIAYFHQFPDSPDGKKLAFTIFKPGEKMDVVVKDLEAEQFFTINTVNGIQRHSGTHPLWIDNQTLVYGSSKEKKIYLHNINTGELNEFDGHQISDYSTVNEKVLFVNKNGKLKEGVFTLDVNTKEIECLISLDDVKGLKEEMKTNISLDGWNFDHPYFSPDGKTIMFQIKAKVKSKKGVTKKREAYYLFADGDGKNIRFVGRKPMHIQWWDNESTFGFETDNQSNHRMQRYDLYGNVIQEDAVGHGNHGTASPNREWIVTDSWYQTDPIITYLYKLGEVNPTRVLFQQPNVVKGKNFWDVHSHIHPAFSRDGTKVYFNGMANDGLSKVWCYDLSEVIEERSR